MRECENVEEEMMSNECWRIHIKHSVIFSPLKNPITAASKCMFLGGNTKTSETNGCAIRKEIRSDSIGRKKMPGKEMIQT